MITDRDRQTARETTEYAGMYTDAELAEIVAQALADERERVIARFLALAEFLENEAAERDRMADRLSDAPAYHMEINRLVVGAKHQERAAKQIRRAIEEAE